MKKFKVTARITGTGTVEAVDKYEAGSRVRADLMKVSTSTGIFTDVRIVKVEEVK